MADASDQLSLSATKRPRPVISCLECRRKKLKCDRTHPCQQCIKIGRPGQCEYQEGVEPLPNIAYSLASPAKRQRIHSPSVEALDRGPVALNGSQGLPVSSTSRGVIEDLQERVARLENAVLAGNTRREESQNPPIPESMAPETNGTHVDELDGPSTSHPLKSVVSPAIRVKPYWKPSLTPYSSRKHASSCRICKKLSSSPRWRPSEMISRPYIVPLR